MWVLRQPGLPIFRSATIPWLTYKLCFCKKRILFETSLMKVNFHTSILDDWSHFCNWFSNFDICIDLKLRISGDWSKFVDWSKSWKQDIFDQLPVIQPVCRLFSQFNLSNYVTASYIIWLNNVDQKTVIISKQIEIIYHEKLITKI